MAMVDDQPIRVYHLNYTCLNFSSLVVEILTLFWLKFGFDLSHFNVYKKVISMCTKDSILYALCVSFQPRVV